MSKMKFRIIKKSKEGVLISPAKGAEPVKMGWDELKKNYTIENDVWAVPTEECIKKMDEINEHVGRAAAAFVMAGGLKDHMDDLTQMLMLGNEIEKITELAGCSRMEACGLVKKAVNMLANPTPEMFEKPRRHRRENQESRPVAVTEEKHGNAIMADDPGLLALKEKFNSENK